METRAINSLNIKVSMYMAVSGNGMIANEKKVPDWLSREYAEGFTEICEKAKAVVMGKTTYDLLIPDHLPLKKEGTIIVITNDINKKSANPLVAFTDKQPVEIINMLADKEYKEVVVIGGATTVSAFMQAGLIEDIYLVVEPFFFTNGLPLFKNVNFEYKLSLIEVKKLNKDTVRFHYKYTK
jgi:dihydrofolate reductase